MKIGIIKYRAFFVYTGESNELFRRGKKYYLTVKRGIFGRTTIDCRRPQFSKSFTIAKIKYRTYQQFESFWEFHHGIDTRTS